LQGHNVFGSDDLLALVFDTYLKLIGYLDIKPELSDIKTVKEGAYRLTRVDINYSYDLPSRSDVLAFIRALEFKAKSRHGRPSMKAGTLYFGTARSRWRFCAYSKGEEIAAGKKHCLPDALIGTPITAWADNKLRLELRLMRKELDSLEIVKANQLTPEKVKMLYQNYARKIDMSEQIALSDKQLLDLPRRLRSTYILWKNGEDLRSTLPHNTFYRHRRELKEYGIDILLRQESLNTSNVVPMFRILEACPASLPDWAFTDGLIHSSARA